MVSSVAHKIVDDRMGNDDKDGPDMIVSLKVDSKTLRHKLKNLQSSFKRHGLSVDEIKTETILQLIAGSDTTATAIRTTMLYLMTCPRAYARVKEEIKDAIAAGAAHPVAHDQAKKLSYLQVGLTSLRTWH